MFNLHLDLKYKYVPKIFNAKLPEKCTVFDLCYDSKRLMWMNWTQIIEKYITPKQGSFTDIIVPTNDSIRNNYFLHKSI